MWKERRRATNVSRLERGIRLRCCPWDSFLGHGTPFKKRRLPSPHFAASRLEGTDTALISSPLLSSSFKKKRTHHPRKNTQSDIAFGAGAEPHLHHVEIHGVAGVHFCDPCRRPSSEEYVVLSNSSLLNFDRETPPFDEGFLSNLTGHGVE